MDKFMEATARIKGVVKANEDIQNSDLKAEDKEMAKVLAYDRIKLILEECEV